MASKTDPNSTHTWVAIDIAKGANAALVEHADGKQQRLRFMHSHDDYNRLIVFLRSCAAPCRIVGAEQGTAQVFIPA